MTSSSMALLQSVVIAAVRPCRRVCRVCRGPVRVCVFVMLLPGGLGAHAGDRVVFVPELTDADLLEVDVLDGDIDEWPRLVGEPVVTDADFSRLYGAGREPSFRFRIWLGWHGGSSRLFVAAEMADDRWVNNYTRGGMGIQFDSFLGIGVDGDHSGDEWYVHGTDPPYSKSQEYWVMGVTVGVSEHVDLPYYHHGLEPFAIHAPYAAGGGARHGEQPIITIAEAYVTAFDDMDWVSPTTSRRSEMRAGQVIGLALKLVDADSGEMVNRWFTAELAEYYFLPGTWGKYKIRYHTTEGRRQHSTLFADAVLLPASDRDDRGGLDGEARDSWARIKATLSESRGAGGVER